MRRCAPAEPMPDADRSAEASAARMFSNDEIRLPKDDSVAFLAARTFSNSTGWLPQWIGLLAMLEGFVRTWDDPRQAPRRPADRVYERDGWRCAAPGCTSQQNLEEHHIVYRSRGGSNRLSNRVTACRFHHQHGEHGGLARCRGHAPLGLAWTLGRGGVGGNYRCERRLE